MSQLPMQAIQVHAFGGPEQLRLERIPRPEPLPGEALIRVHAVGVLPAEWKMRQGLFQNRTPFPYLPGSALAGVVESVAPDVTDFAPEQAVFGRTTHGAYAEYAAAAVETLALKPDGVTFAEAATISGGATVAYTTLFENAGLQRGQRILIHGGAGGVGLFAVQLAARHGAHVVATAGPANVEFVRSLGAETVIDYAAQPFEQAAREVDVVLDTVGGETLRRSMPLVRRGGIVVSLLEEPPQDAARDLGIRAMHNSVTQPFPSTRLLQTIVQMMAAGQIRTVIAREFALSEAAQAHELSEAGHGRGRIVLRVADDVRYGSRL